jgi:hypothetical protein
MERSDVIILEIDLDERLPVVIAFVDVNAIEHVAGEIDLRNVDVGQVARERRACRRRGALSSS